MSLPLRGASALIVRAEDALSVAAFAAMVLLALGEVAARTLGGHSIPGSIVLVQQLTLWVALLGAALAGRSDRLLALSTPFFLPTALRRPIRTFTSALGSGIAAWLAVASADLVRVERAAGGFVAWGIPAWIAMSILPTAFAVIAGRLVWHAADTTRGRLLAACGLALPFVVGMFQAPADSRALVPSLLVIAAATACGMPVFAAMGGAALLFFWGDGTPANAVPGEAYRLTTSPMLPAIPLFALGGYLLAEGGASRRLTRLFAALFSWMPGGLAIVTTLVLAFFTPLTGASGVTILSMGGVLLPVLVGARYAQSTSIGLVTVSGSIGLLFFPSLPVFLYAFYANVPFERLFVAGLLPGVLLVMVVAGWAAFQGWLRGALRTPFEWREAASAIWEAKWDLALPAIVLGGVVAGIVTLVEAAAFTALYALVFECFVHRTLSVTRDVPRVVVDCATLIGGFMIILGVALGFTNYLVIAEIPTRVLEWSQARIESPLLFLLALNAFLIIVGALMDIYSAIVVVVPLILPMANAYGVDPVHLAVIFLANMELGYLMPPMGENLFLASYRFNQPLIRIYRSTLPYTAILLVAVLLITFIPWLSLSLVSALKQCGYLAP
jgi:C4-dicarboxylate transporter, DctM subunit